MNSSTISLMLALAFCEGLWLYRLLSNLFPRRAVGKNALAICLATVLMFFPTALQLLLVAVSRNRVLPFVTPLLLIPFGALFLSRNTLGRLRQATVVAAVCYTVHACLSTLILLPVVLARDSEVTSASSFASPAQEYQSVPNAVTTGARSRTVREVGGSSRGFGWSGIFAAMEPVLSVPASGIRLGSLRCSVETGHGSGEARLEISGSVALGTNRLIRLITALRNTAPSGYQVRECQGVRLAPFEVRTVAEDGVVPFSMACVYERTAPARSSAPRDSALAVATQTVDPIAGSEVVQMVRMIVQKLNLSVESVTESKLLIRGLAEGSSLGSESGACLTAHWNWDELLAFVKRIESTEPQLEIRLVSVTASKGATNLAVELVVSPMRRAAQATSFSRGATQSRVLP